METVLNPYPLNMRAMLVTGETIITIPSSHGAGTLRRHWAAIREYAHTGDGRALMAVNPIIRVENRQRLVLRIRDFSEDELARACSIEASDIFCGLNQQRCLAS